MVVLPVKKAKGLAAVGVLIPVCERCFFCFLLLSKARPKANFRAKSSSSSSTAPPAATPAKPCETPVKAKPPVPDAGQRTILQKRMELKMLEAGLLSEALTWIMYSTFFWFAFGRSNMKRQPKLGLRSPCQRALLLHPLGQPQLSSLRRQVDLQTHVPL